MSIKIEIFAMCAADALAELRQFSEGLLGGIALSSKVEILTAVESGDASAAASEATQTEDRQEGETEEQHGERKRKRRTKAEMEAARAAEANGVPPEPAPIVVGVDFGAGGATAHTEANAGAEEGRLTGAEDPFPPSGELKTKPAAVDFATAFAPYKEANPDKDEGAFLRAELQKLVDKIGMDAAREFMAVNGYGAVSKIKPGERTAFLTAVYDKLGE